MFELDSTDNLHYLGKFSFESNPYMRFSNVLGSKVICQPSMEVLHEKNYIYNIKCSKHMDKFKRTTSFITIVLETRYDLFAFGAYPTSP